AVVGIPMKPAASSPPRSLPKNSQFLRPIAHGRNVRSEELFIIPSDCAPSRRFRSRDRASSPSSATSGERPGTQPKPLRSPRCWLGYVPSETEEPAHRDHAGIRRSPLRTALDIIKIGRASGREGQQQSARGG